MYYMNNFVRFFVVVFFKCDGEGINNFSRIYVYVIIFLVKAYNIVVLRLKRMSLVHVIDLTCFVTIKEHSLKNMWLALKRAVFGKRQSI